MNIKFPKKTMTLNLSPSEMEIAKRMASEKGTTLTGLVRTALRFYQSLDAEVNKGDGWRIETRIVDKDGKEVRNIRYIE